MRRAFTLVELLTVMAIIALMVSIAGLSMRSVRGSAVKQGASQLKNHLTLARARAIGDRTKVCVVFSQGANTGATARPLTTYGICILTNRMEGSSTASTNWVYLGGWFSLPSGAFFPPAQITSLGTVSLPFPTNRGPATALNCIQIKPTGAPSAAASMIVMEGTVLDQYVPPVVAASNAANRLTVTLDAFTGRSAVQ